MVGVGWRSANTALNLMTFKFIEQDKKDIQRSTPITERDIPFHSPIGVAIQEKHQVPDVVELEGHGFFTLFSIDEATATVTYDKVYGERLA